MGGGTELMRDEVEGIDIVWYYYCHAFRADFDPCLPNICSISPLSSTLFTCVSDFK